MTTHVGGESIGTDLAVANRRERLNAEEERLAEAAAEHMAAGTGKRLGTTRQEQQGEHEVQHHIGQRDHADETCPRDGQEQVVGRERRDPAEPFAHDVERAVTIEEPPPAVAADNGAEAEVAVAKLRLGGDASGERAGIKGAGHTNRRVRDAPSSCIGAPALQNCLVDHRNHAALFELHRRNEHRAMLPR